MSIDPSSRAEVDNHSASSLNSSLPVVGEHPKAAEEKKRASSSIETKKSSPAKTLLAATEKISATLAEQQLMALLTEAQTYQARLGYEHQIKAAFYYQVVWAFCDKKLVALIEVSKTEAKKPEAREKKEEAIASSKDWAAFYTAEKEKIIQALATLESTYSQKALELPASIAVSSTLSLTESKTSSASLPSHDLFVKRLVVNPHKLALQRIRVKATSLLEIYKKQSAIVTSETKAEIKSVLTMQGIYRELTADMKQLICRMIADCIEEYTPLLGYPPCEYAFFGLGSMARDEMTPYSDLEFGILIAEEDKSSINKTYFQHITQILHLKIINLGETIPRIMGVELPTIKIHTGVKIEQDEIPNPIPNGLSFDGVGPGGCKNPLGRKDKFALLGTPQALADYQDPKHYDDQGKLQDERFLPASLAHVTLIAGGKAGQLLESRSKVTSDSPVAGEILLEQYQKVVHHTLNQPATTLWGNPLTGKKFTLRQARALELLLSDLERFSPKLGKVEADGRSFSVKHDFYRLPNTLLDQIALYYGLEAQSLWEQISKLTLPTTTDKEVLLSEEAARNLRRAIDSIGYHRLSAYLRLGEQNEEARLGDDKGVMRTYGATHQRYYELSASDAFAIYYCLIPLWQAVKRFRDSAGNQEAFQASCLELYREDSFIKGQIKQLLQGYRAALPDYEESVAEARQLVEALALSFKIPVAEAKEDKEEKKSIQKEHPSPSDIPSKELADALYALGITQRELRQSDDAETNLKEAHMNFQALGRDAIAETGACLLSLALLLNPQGKTRATEAQKYLAEATDLIQQQYGKRHPYFAYCVAIKGELETTFRHMTPDWHIPLSNDETFVGREDLLKQLANQFVAMEAGQRLLLSAVSGLGGVGKTTLAIQYLHHSKHPYELRVWFRAESTATLSADYRDFAIEKRLIEPGDKVDIKELIALVKHYLEKHTGWLAIYDNVENYEDIKDYLPAKGGHVIVSTRRQEWPSFWPAERTAGWGKLTVDVFTLEEALLYLKKLTGHSGLEEEANMKLLAEELGRLPLALAQAAAYIKRRGVTVADYLNRYQQRKCELLADKLLPADSESLPVASTWDVSIAHILDEEGLLMTPERSISWNILQAMSYLHSEDIPCALLERWLQDAGHCKDAANAKQQLETALQRLQAYSLVHYQSEKQMVSLHRVVQAVMRERFDLQPRKSMKEEKGSKAVVTSDSKEKSSSKLAVSQESIGIEAAILQAQVGRGQAKQGKLLEAERSLREAIALFKRYDKSYAAELSKCYLDLAAVLVQKEKEAGEAKIPGEAKLSEEVTGYIKEAQSLVAVQYGAVHPLVARCAHVERYLKTPLSAGKRALWHWQIPTKPTSFIKRDNYDQYFHQVTHSFDAHLAHVQAPLTVLLGLAGIGKTTLANDYVHKLEYPYDLRIWFQADSPAILLNEYRTFSKDLGLLPREEQASEGEILYAVKSYLESYPDWLAVYDNAGSYPSLKKFLPTRGGHILVTSCRKEWQDVARVTLEITQLAQEMKAEDATQLGRLLDKQLETIQQEEEQIGDKPLSRPLLYFMLEKAKEEKLACPLFRTLLENWMLGQKKANDITRAKIDTDKALGYLQNYLLVAVSEDRLKVTVHPLLQMMFHQGVGFDKSSIPPAASLESKSDAKATVPYEQPVHFLLLGSLTDSSLEEFNLETNVLVDEKRTKILLPHLQALVKHHDMVSSASTLLTTGLGGLLDSIGWVFGGQLSDAAQAKLYLERALKIKELHYSKIHWQVAITLNNLANAYGDLGDTQKKKTLLSRALKIVEQHFDPDGLPVASTLDNLASVINDLGDAKMAKSLLERALTIKEAHFGRDHWQVAITLGNLATAVGDLGDASTQKSLLERALIIFEAHFGRDHWQVALTLTSLANVISGLGDAKTAKSLLEHALTIKEAHYGRDHRLVANTLINLANAIGALGDLKMAKSLFERALTIKEAHYGRDHWEVASTLTNFANAVGALGDVKTQKFLLERALTIKEAHYGHDHWEVASTLGHLANVIRVLGDAKTARLLLESAFPIVEAHYGHDHLEVASMLNNLANAYGVLGEAQKKRTLLERALRIKEQHYGKDHWEVASMLVNLATAMEDLRDAKAAKSLLERALTIFESHYGRDHWQVAITLTNLANAVGDLGDVKTQKNLLERALKIKEAHYGRDHWQVTSTLVNLATAIGDLGDANTAKHMLERALTINEAHYGYDHWQVAMTLNNLGNVYRKLGDIATALKYAQRVYRIFNTSFENPAHPHVQTAARNLQQLQHLQLQQEFSELKQTLEQASQTEQAISSLCQPSILTLLQQREIDTARYYFESENINFDDSKVHTQLAEYYEKQKHFLGAIIHFEQALSLAQQAKEPLSRLTQLNGQLSCVYLCHHATLKQSGKSLTEQQSAEALSKKYFEESVKGLAEFNATDASFLLRQEACYNAMMTQAVGGNVMAVRQVLENYTKTLSTSLAKPGAVDAKASVSEGKGDQKQIPSRTAQQSSSGQLSDNPHRFLPSLPSTQEVKAVSHFVSQEATKESIEEDELQKALQLSLSLSQNAEQQDEAKTEEAAISEEEQLKRALQMSLSQ